VYLSSRLTREFPRRTCVVGFGVMLRLIEDGESGEGGERIEKGELVFLLKFFERAIEELGVKVKEREGLEIGNAVLEGETEGLVIRGEFSVSCWRSV